MKFRTSSTGNSCFAKRSLKVEVVYDLEILNSELKSKCSYDENDLLTSSLGLPSILYYLQDNSASPVYSTTNIWNELENETVTVHAKALNDQTTKITLDCEINDEFATWPGEQFTVSAKEVKDLEGCEGETGSIQLAVDGKTVNSLKYIVRTNVNDHVYSSFFLDMLPAGNYEISVTSQNKCEQTISNIIVSENEKCSIFLFRVWSKGGLPGSIVIACTVVIAGAILFYYRRKFVPREKTRMKADEARYRARLLRHKKARRKICEAALNKYVKKAEKKIELIPVKQVEKDDKVEGVNEVIEKDKAVAIEPIQFQEMDGKRIVPSTRVLCGLNDFDDALFENVPITKLSEIDPNLNIAFPGMRFSYPNPLSEFYLPSYSNSRWTKAL